MKKKEEIIEKLYSYLEQINNKDENISKVVKKALETYYALSEKIPSIKDKKNQFLERLLEGANIAYSSLEELKVISLLYRISMDIINNKADKLVKLQELLEKADNIPDNLKEKIIQDKETASEKIVEIYGELNQIISNSHSLEETKTKILSVLTLGSEDADNYKAMIYVVENIDISNDGLKNIEDFFQKNQVLLKIDKYVEELVRFIEVSEKSKDRKQQEIGI